ncbi:MAG: ABC transporter permease [Ignavibacteriaceae bacterium]
MKVYFQLAWRNIWRNKKRTVIAAASVFFAVILALIMRSMQQGSYEYMIEASVSMYTGYIQIHGKEFWEKRSLDQSMTVSTEKIDSVTNIPEVTNVVPRLESYALVSHNQFTKVGQIVGIDPVSENLMTGLKDKLIQGSYLTNPDDGALLSEGLASLLKVSVGDSIVIYGQGYHGVTAAARIPIAGIVKFKLPELNNTMLYLTLGYAQWLFSAENRLTSLSVMIDKHSSIQRIYDHISALFDDNYEVMTWAELMPELVQSIEADNAGGIIMLAILYIVIGFGIFGTVMMMTAERIREFGILVSVGMKKWRLITVTTLETILISLTGVISGAVVSIPILIYFINNPVFLTGKAAEAMLAFGLDPILPFTINTGMFVVQVWTVLAIALFSAIYPFLFIRKLNPVEALRG